MRFRLPARIFAAAAVLVMFGLPAPAEAFCLYNYTDRGIRFIQQANIIKLWKAFDKTVASKGNACCNWQNRDCNPGGKKTSTVEFMAQLTVSNRAIGCGPGKGVPGMEIENPHVAVEAGGWVEVYKAPGYDRKKYASKDNPFGIAQSYKADGSLLASFHCPHR